MLKKKLLNKVDEEKSDLAIQLFEALDNICERTYAMF